MFIFFKFIFS